MSACVASASRIAENSKESDDAGGCGVGSFAPALSGEVDGDAVEAEADAEATVSTRRSSEMRSDCAGDCAEAEAAVAPGRTRQ